MSYRPGERPPLWLAWQITSANGRPTRWGGDEPDARNVPQGNKLSTQAPGGHKSADCELIREDRDWPDLNVLDDTRVYGAGGRTAFEGRLSEQPRGLRSISPSAEGYAATLRDDPSFRCIFRDIDLTRWDKASNQRQINLRTGATDIFDPTVVWDQTASAVDVGIDGAWSRANTRCEAYYNAGGLGIGSVYASVKSNGALSAADGNWTVNLYLSTDDVLTVVQFSADLRAALPTTVTLTASGSTKKFAMLYTNYAVAAGGGGVHYATLWRPVVYGNHGLTPVGTEPNAGFLASQVIAYALPLCAPQLNFTTGATGSIRDSAFKIPHLIFPDLSTAEDVVNGANRFEQYDYFVYDNRTFIYRPATTYGRRWKVRLGDGVEPKDSGPQSVDTYNGAVVVYKDETGTTRTIGPTGSRCEYTDSALLDASSSNPVNAHGIARRWTKVEPTATVDRSGAVQLGYLVLQALGRRTQRGELAVNGWAEDEHGVIEPVWMMRSGDVVNIIDSSDPETDRRIINTSYDEDAQFKNTLTLDAPPNRIDALQERLGVVITPLGL